MNPITNINHLAELQAACLHQHFDYYPFWGHHPKNKPQIDRACLSQWFPAPFVVQETTYPTAEHYMMAQKALLFDDQQAFEQILSNPSPQHAKNWGRKVKRFHEAKWSEHNQEIVFQGNLAKFSQHPKLKHFLLSTGNSILVEASPFDLRHWHERK